MTKEEKAKMLLDVYEHEKQRLVNEYKSKETAVNSKRVNLSQKEADNIKSKINELNTWYEIELTRIENRFLKAILHIEGE